MKGKTQLRFSSKAENIVMTIFIISSKHDGSDQFDRYGEEQGLNGIGSLLAIKT